MIDNDLKCKIISSQVEKMQDEDNWAMYVVIERYFVWDINKLDGTSRFL